MARLTSTQEAIADAIQADALKRIRHIETDLEIDLFCLRWASLRYKGCAAKRAFRLVQRASDICDEAEAAIRREYEETP